MEEDHPAVGVNDPTVVKTAADGAEDLGKDGDRAMSRSAMSAEYYVACVRAWLAARKGDDGQRFAWTRSRLHL